MHHMSMLVIVRATPRCIIAQTEALRPLEELLSSSLSSSAQLFTRGCLQTKVKASVIVVLRHCVFVSSRIRFVMVLRRLAYKKQKRKERVEDEGEWRCPRGV